MLRALARIAPLLMLVGIAVSSCASPSASTPTSTAPISAAPEFPTVDGAFGMTPTISFPHEGAPSGLESKVLVRGTGPVVEKGDLLVANYVGQIWQGKVFDSSFSRHALAAFPIGLRRVIPGWDKTLVGVRAGSRMLLVIPPVDGYGVAGNSSAGIRGTDTLVFVVDIVASYSGSVTGDLQADVLSAGVSGIAVSGPLGGPPTVRIGTVAPPTTPTVTILAKGHGPIVNPGLVVLQYVAVDWTTSSVVQSTWQTGFPDGEVVGESATPGALDLLTGIPVGSRVLVEVPKTSKGGPFVFVVDIVAEPTF